MLPVSRVYTHVCTGVCSEKGRGITESWDSAVHWYRLAAEQGHAAAQFNLAVCYERGQGAVQDLSMAARYYRM